MKTIKPLFLANSIVYCIILLVVTSCSNGELETQFQLISSEQSGISFSNDLSYTDDFNVYKYRNFYNGGGIAVGDINNDGLVDLYFTANQKSNELYLNELIISLFPSSYKFSDFC